MSDENVFRVVTERVYDNALPLFRRMMEQGKVRVTIPNHVKVSTFCISRFSLVRPSLIIRILSTS